LLHGAFCILSINASVRFYLFLLLSTSLFWHYLSCSRGDRLRMAKSFWISSPTHLKLKLWTLSVVLSFIPIQ